MDDPGTESLCKLAPSWSLAGDEQLLSILQNTHQRLLSKCQEANTQLEQMATALNDASISLQNVNNQFMALSSSQFIESRVYDDDLEGDVPVVKEPPKPDVPDELACLKRSVLVLESAHEIITILHDSDTESDSDDDMPARLVLKPRDMYADRPLPYIIGSQPWKDKWHAGLLLEDSDSDSSISKVDHDSEQYSQSEPEDNADKLRVRDTRDVTISESSSELPSEQGSVPKPTPSDVASEIARRLGAREPPKVVERAHEYEEPAKPEIRKIYRPQDPVKSTIFPDEPPPLSDSDSQESDIFADLHRHQPYSKTRLAEDLFDTDRYESDGGDIFGDFANKPVTDPSAKPTSLFDAGPAPHMFDKHKPSDDGNNMVRSQGSTEDRKPNIRQGNSAEDQRGNLGSTEDHQANMVRQGSSTEDRKVNMVEKYHEVTNKQRDERRVEIDAADGGVKDAAHGERGVKKPVGGISLFGSKGTESIGAAILKRNQRKSSTSGEDSGSDVRSEALHNNEQKIRKEKDIFDDLFARSEVKKVTKDKSDIVKDLKTEIRKKTEEKVNEKKVEKPKVDLFSDNLFDDIDDIFSTNVVKMPSKDNTKSIFDDDDDLFSDVAAPKTVKNEASSSKIIKESLFDSDDELFSDNVIKSKHDEKPKISEIATKVNKINENSMKISEPPKISDEMARSIFDDDEDDIFSDVKLNNKVNEVTKVQNTPVSTDKYNDLSREDGQASKNMDQPKNNTNVFKSSSLFDDDDDESDLFAGLAKSPNVQNVTTVPVKDFEETSNKNEIKITEQLQNNIDLIPSSSIKTDDFEQKVVEYIDDDKNSKTNESGVNKIVNNESFKNIEEDSQMADLPVSENVDRNNLDTFKNIETTAAKIIEDKNKQNVEQSFSESKDDSSDQDFDDLPPKVAEINENLNINSNIVTDVKSSEAHTDVHNIFNNSTLEGGIFANIDENKQNTQNSESIFKDIDPTETIPKDFEKTEQDNKTNQIDTKNIEADIFSDIVTEPPAFEKPKEPKKSKNVNALFDDDSDDESLFFKKNDTIFEDNPEDFSPTQDPIFGLFTDEPPEEGFSKISGDLDDDMFTTLPKPKIPQNESLPPLPSNVDLEDNTPIHISENKIPEINKLDLDEDIFGSSVTNETKSAAETPKLPVSDIKKNSKNVFKAPSIENLQNSLPFIEKQEPRPSKKPTISDQLIQGLLSDDDEDLFQSIPTFEQHYTSLPTPKQEVPLPENKNQDPVKTLDDELFNTTPKSNTLKKEIIKPDADTKSDEDVLKIPKSKPDSKPKPEHNQTSEKPPTDSKPKQVENKKVGKLKVGLNINVNALLPGAKSPKKAKPIDHPDGQILSVSENKKPEPKFPENEKSEPKIVSESEKPDPTSVKTVSFDGKPESEVLDNKLSKERPRIQVKRRPSTRRARKEAVRKSGIDFGEDSTDNSSSIDDVPRNRAEIQPDTDEMVDKDDGVSKTSEEDKLEKPNMPAENIDEPKMQAKPEETTIQAEIQVTSQPEIEDKPSYSRDVKSKVVYILNDEDIFNTKPIEKPGITKNLDTKFENLDSNLIVTTLGKVYDRSDIQNDKGPKKDPQTSIFGDDDDDKIFKGKTEEKKLSIFDSDSEEELFGTSKKEVEKKEVRKEIKREVVKGSLFGDEDDDDLFGVKTKKRAEPKPQPSRSMVKETLKSTEPVFEDPLSMFGDDD